MYRILICDDQKDIVNALKIYLTPEGYDLYEAYNGQEAVELCRKTPMDLILLDVMMPVMDGVTATAKIREFSNAPIILLTAKSETEDKVLGLNVGADDYITKPFVPVEVLARIRSQLRRYSRMDSRTEDKETLTIGGISLDDRTKSVTVEGVRHLKVKLLLMTLPDANHTCFPQILFPNPDPAFSDSYTYRTGMLSQVFLLLPCKLQTRSYQPWMSR